jgi:hypothetical protein
MIKSREGLDNDERKPREGQSTIERKSIQHHETVKRKARESQVKVNSESQEEVERKLRESPDLGLAVSGHGRRVHVRRHGGDLQIHAPQLTRTRVDGVLWLCACQRSLYISVWFRAELSTISVRVGRHPR